MGLAFHATRAVLISFSLRIWGWGGMMERNEIRIQPSNQRNWNINPALCFSLGFMLLKKGWNSGPANKLVARTVLRMKGCPSSTAPLSNSNYFAHSFFTQPRLHLWSRPPSKFHLGDPGSSGLALPSSRKESPSKERCHTRGRAERIWQHLQECRAHAGVLAPTNFLFKRAW